MRPAVFLDRDGVIIQNRPDYVRSWEDVAFIPGVLPALAQLARLPCRVVVITNQAGIGKGIISQQGADEINRRLIEVIIRHGGRIDGIYVCPHRPEDQCECRKPKPGLILQAAQELDIDLQTSLLVGDNLSDLQAARAGGVGKAVLVRTGLGETFISSLPAAGFEAVSIYDSLVEALSTWEFMR